MLHGQGPQREGTGKPIRRLPEDLAQAWPALREGLQRRKMLVANVRVIAGRRLATRHPFGVVVQQQLQDTEAGITVKTADIDWAQGLRQRRKVIDIGITAAFGIQDLNAHHIRGRRHIAAQTHLPVIDILQLQRNFARGKITQLEAVHVQDTATIVFQLFAQYLHILAVGAGQ
ncbi:hypothetical protein BSG18_49880 [Pseudomonas ogarae]|nr:hypothetical protein BSG18_49880 [Pseudomonas ogarae]